MLISPHLKEVDQLWQRFRRLSVEKAEYVSKQSDAQKETETLRYKFDFFLLSKRKNQRLFSAEE